MRRGCGWALAFMAAFWPAARAIAAPVRFTLEPGSVTIDFRAWGLGLLPIDGHFTRFHGTLTLDDSNPAACTLTLDGESASLEMPSASMTADAQGTDLLDVQRFPLFRVDGACADGKLRGTLLLHGVSGPVVMQAGASGAHAWKAAGLVRRAEWGMGARPLMAGPEVRITVTAGLPPDFKLGARSGS